MLATSDIGLEFGKIASQGLPATTCEDLDVGHTKGRVEWRGSRVAAMTETADTETVTVESKLARCGL